MRRSKATGLGRGPLVVVALLALLWLGARGAGPLPPLGPLLDPVNGVWSAARQAHQPALERIVIPSLDAPVDVVVDDRGVPHVYARTVPDAIRALGYLQARDRLFQLELQVRATAGRLTELVGARALPLDREQRALGLAWSARRAWQSLPPSSPDHALYTALAEGINARIDGLGRGGVPFEYHFLGARPAPWEPVNSLLVERRMAYTLSYANDDLWRLRAAALVGQAAADALYPVHSPIQEPIQPNGEAPVVREHSLPPPAPRRAALLRQAEALLAAVPAPAPVPPGIVVGSNNWAVAGARSASGNALLAGDPHLQLTLPSIWYEVHLVVEGELDVHGVTIPGVPGVIIGFTPDVAWSVTNNLADVVDFYRETLDDADAPTRYRLDGAWAPLQASDERFFGRDGELLAHYTQHYTHRGPLTRAGGEALSMRWLALERGASPSSFLAAARARDVDGLLAAFAGFASPAQNFVMADRGGRIAIRSTGLYPIRPDDDGRVIRDGSTRASDWQGFWPLQDYPQAVDPAQGYLASANQQPVDPREQPRYLGSNWTSPWRALQINALLREATAPDAAAMRAFQTDPGNAKARLVAPFFVAAADGDPALAPAVALLRGWDHRYTPDAEAALLFEAAFSRLQDALWDELELDAAAAGDLPPPPRPREVIVHALLDEPASAWWDDARTPAVEDRDALLRRALGEAFATLLRDFGPPGDGAWRWAAHRHANIHHLARLPGLGRLGLALAGGGPGNLNPSSGSGTHGASWRMVVELDRAEGARASAVYPGGQSGNPASPRYDDRLAAWQAGRLEEVFSPPRAEQIPASRVSGALHLRPSALVEPRR